MAQCEFGEVLHVAFAFRRLDMGRIHTVLMLMPTDT